MLFQSNLRKQIRKLPKFLKFVRIIHYYSKLFTGVLTGSAGARGRGTRGLRAVRAAEQDRAGALAAEFRDERFPARRLRRGKREEQHRRAEPGVERGSVKRAASRQKRFQIRPRE